MLNIAKGSWDPRNFETLPLFVFVPLFSFAFFLILSFTGKTDKCHSGSIPEEAMMAPAGLKQPRMPGSPLPPVGGVFSGFCGFSNNFSSFFYHVSNVFCSLKIPRCWVAAYGMMTTALWTLRSRNFCNFEPSPDNWGLAMSHPRIWLVLLGEADTGESRKLKIWGWNTLKRQVSEDKSLNTCENNLLWTSLGGSFEIFLLAATSFSAQMLEMSSHILLFESLVSFDIDHFVIQSRWHLPLCRWAGLGLLSSRWTVPCQCFKKKVFWLEGKEMWLRFFDLRKLKDLEGKRWKLWSKGRWGEFHRNRFPRGIALGMVV